MSLPAAKQKASSPAESQNVRRAIAISSARERRFGAMRPTPMEFLGDMDDQGSTMAMDVDDADTLESFADGIIGENKLADADFFNSFEDDFDDTNVN